MRLRERERVGGGGGGGGGGGKRGSMSILKTFQDNPPKTALIGRLGYVRNTTTGFTDQTCLSI